mgnify:FL=1
MRGYDGATVLAISEGLTGNSPMPQMAEMRLSATKVDAAPVQPGMVQAGVNISITYELVKNSGSPAK